MYWYVRAREQDNNCDDHNTGGVASCEHVPARDGG